MKTSIRIGLLIGIGAIIAAGLWKGFASPGLGGTQSGAPEGGATSAAVNIDPSKLTTVRLLTGSAKFALLQDPQVVALMAKQGINLKLERSGAFDKDVTRSEDFDAVWPAGENAAMDFAQAWKSSNTYHVFDTPLAVASWQALMPTLQANGLVKSDAGVMRLQLESTLQMMLAGKRWKDLKDNTVFAVNRGFLINTPDIRKTNTGLMYVMALAYIANGNEVPTIEKADTLAAKIAPVITRQGFSEATLMGPFEDYLGTGMGKAPMVLVYESQFIEAKRDGKIRDTHQLLYLDPGLVLKHVVVARNGAGQRLGDVLSKNPEFLKIAARYGFRVVNADIFQAQMKEFGLPAPELLNLVQLPSTKVMDTIGKAIVLKIEGQ